MILRSELVSITQPSPEMLPYAPNELHNPPMLPECFFHSTDEEIACGIDNKIQEALSLSHTYSGRDNYALRQRFHLFTLVPPKKYVIPNAESIPPNVLKGAMERLQHIGLEVLNYYNAEPIMTTDLSDENKELRPITSSYIGSPLDILPPRRNSLITGQTFTTSNPNLHFYQLSFKSWVIDYNRNEAADKIHRAEWYAIGTQKHGREPLLKQTLRGAQKIQRLIGAIT